MELWDVLDRERRLTNKTHVRGVPLRKGEYHLAVFVWVFDRQGRVLLTKRSPEKETFPNLWAITGGSVIAGETSLHAIARELREETGISAAEEEFTLVQQFLRRNCFCDVYFLRKTVPLEQLVMQPGETCGARWAGRKEFEYLASQGLIASQDVRRYAQLEEKLKNYMK